MSVESLTAQEVIAKAEQCYSLGLIDQAKLEYITRQAETNPGYNGVIDMPFDWEVEHEIALRRRAARRTLPWWRRLFHV